MYEKTVQRITANKTASIGYRKGERVEDETENEENSVMKNVYETPDIP